VNPLYLIGAGGHGKVAADIAELSGYTKITFLDSAYPAKKNNGPWPIVGNYEDFVTRNDFSGQLFVTIGDNSNRAKVWNSFTIADSPKLIHPTATIAKNVELGSGSLIVAGVIINPYAKIGRAVILNTACTIDHDCQLDDFVHISPGANLAGEVHVGEASWIGIGASVNEGISIGRHSIVAAGAVVTNDVPDYATVMGVPAKEVTN